MRRKNVSNESFARGHVRNSLVLPKTQACSIASRGPASHHWSVSAVTKRDNGANTCYGGCVSLYILPRTRLLRLLANCDRPNHSAQSWSRLFCQRAVRYGYSCSHSHRDKRPRTSRRSLRFASNEWRQHMKGFGVIGLTTLFLLLGTTVPAFAQEEHHDEGAKPAEHQEQAKPAKQEQAKPENSKSKPSHRSTSNRPRLSKSTSRKTPSNRPRTSTRPRKSSNR